MKRIVLTFGLIAGGILSVMMLATIPFMEQIGFDRGEVIGYTSMMLAFLMIFFGVRSYRDNVAGGVLSFGRAFRVGSLIGLVASICYVATWQFIYYRITPDFLERYQAHAVAEARAEGATEAEIARRSADMAKWAALYRNPAVNVAITFLEPLPVALVVALIAAGVLRRRPDEPLPGSPHPA